METGKKVGVGFAALIAIALVMWLFAALLAKGVRKDLEQEVQSLGGRVARLERAVQQLAKPAAAPVAPAVSTP